MNDASLIYKAKQGDMRAFEELVTMYEKLVFSVAYRYFSNPEDAADIVQETFLKAYRNMNRFSGTSFKSWLCAITTNSCIDELRKRKVRPGISTDDSPEGDDREEHRYISGDPGPLDIITGRETYNEIISAIDGLSTDYRTLIVLRDLEGLSYEELRLATGEKMGTVKSKLSRARKRLREIVRSGV